MGLGAAGFAGDLLLPLALGVAVLGGLRLRMRGAIAVTVVTCLLALIFSIFDIGPFRSGLMTYPPR